MDIYLDKRAVKQIRTSAGVAIEEGETETLREDIAAAFTDAQVEEIERRVDSGDIHEFLAEILEEWPGEDVDELFELLESALIDAGVDIKYASPSRNDEEDEELDEEVDLDDDDDEDDDELTEREPEDDVL